MVQFFDPLMCQHLSLIQISRCAHTTSVYQHNVGLYVFPHQ